MVVVAPGEPLTFDLEVEDDNNDHPTTCEELRAQDIRITGVSPQGLDTTPPLDASLTLQKVATDTTTGTSTFRATVTVATPHPDNENPPEGCQGAQSDPYEVEWSAQDDAGLAVTDPPPVPVVVANVKPVVTALSATPGALHPGVETTLAVVVAVDDANKKEDVTSVTLDASGCGGPEAVELATGDPTGGTWKGEVAVQALSTCTLLATAKDDDCMQSDPEALAIPVANLAPVFFGQIAGWDGEVKECTTILHSVGFSDENGDQLSVVAVIEGPDGPVELPMTRDPVSGHYTGSFEAPCAGTYTVTYRATEVQLPQGSVPHTVESPPWELVVAPETPEKCPKCHAPPVCEPIVAEAFPPVTTYTVSCEGEGLTYTWWTPSCGDLLAELPHLVAWSHPHPPCDATTDHSEEMVSVEVSNGTLAVVCTYQGATAGVGPACEPAMQ
jgi:hypothetical protein